MKELVIKSAQAGQKLDKFLKKYFNEAPQSFIYKMLRKKNITLNNKKADGTETLFENDLIKLFLADETIEKFHTEKKIQKINSNSTLDVLFEDENILLVNKPSNMLSQKAKPSDVSINELIIDYLIKNNTYSSADLETFKPSVCNRLDRNTTGIITFGKNIKGLQFLSEGFKLRTFDKYYLCVVKGVINKRENVEGYLYKDTKNNKVTVFSNKKNDAEYIKTEYIPVADNGRQTLLKIKLHTGKTHQIRAHLAYIGHPLVGDFKYGDKKINQYASDKYKIKDQLLHSFEMVIPQLDLDIVAPIPAVMENYLRGEKIWEPGNQGDLEALH